MKKPLIVAACAAALMAASGAALAQSGPPGPHGRHVMSHDANGDGAVTREELDAARAVMFARLDANSDGAVTRGEMRVGHHGGREHGRGEGRSRDANNDGSVTREEFLAGPNAMFDTLDANDDGVLSTAEMAEHRAHHGRGERGDHGGRGRHGRHGGPGHLDADRDGRITQAEFAAGNQMMFEHLDADHDGRITQAEADASPRRHERH
jgi:Ca2+-binding EF-hand superfamily protein